MGRRTVSDVRPQVWGALWVVYVVWGSTYLAIRVAVHPTLGAGLPPLLTAGARFLTAGALLFLLSVRRPAADGQPDPLGRRQWLSAAIVGTSLLLGGNGLVSIAEQRIASGVAAVVIATVPIWAALAAALLGQERVTPRHAVGLLLGFAGVCALVLGTGGGTVRVSGVLLSLLAALSWAAGSVYARSAPLARRPLVMTAMQMLCGGVACLAAGALAGEAADLHLAAVPARSWIAVAFLVLLGSMLAYTAYAWLLLNARLSLVTTYAYVNPVVAVLLGTLLLDEAFTTRTLIASVTIVTGVALIVSRGGQRVRRPSGAPERDSSEERVVAAVRPRAASDEERPVR